MAASFVDRAQAGRILVGSVRALGLTDPVVLAVPVAPPDVLRELRAEVDHLVCLEAPEDFIAVGLHYDDFHQLDDDEVLALLEGVRP